MDTKVLFRYDFFCHEFSIVFDNIKKEGVFELIDD